MIEFEFGFQDRSRDRVDQSENDKLAVKLSSNHISGCVPKATSGV
jgi:hypothetical protein